MEGEELGVFFGIQSIAFLLVRFNLSKGIIRYFVKLKDYDREKGAFFLLVFLATTILYLLVLCSFFIFRGSLILFFRGNSYEIIRYLPLCFFWGYLILVNITLKAWYICLKHLLWPNFLQNIVLQALVLFTILLHYFNLLSFEGLLIAMLIPYVLNIILLIAYLGYIGELSFSFKLNCFEWSFIYSFAIYNLFIFLSGGIILVMTRIDTIMVLGMCGKYNASIYSRVAFVALLLELPIKVIKQVSSPLLTKMLESKNYNRLQFFYKKYTLNQFFLSCFLFSLLYTNLNYILYTLPPEVKLVGRQVFLILALSEIVRNLFYTADNILLLSLHFKLSMFVSLILIMGVIGNYVMISRWGVVGAAYATLSAMLVSGIFTSFIVRHKLGIHPFSVHLIPIGFFTLFTALTHHYLPTLNQWWLDIVLRSCFVCSIYGVLAFLQNQLKKTHR